ncbi:hypothetical protein BC826DRAFT_1177477 [Russula brevipes]|nr:hypothetical protein BC826DRAFT_1177477 [Russula brevipes]
MWFDSRHSFKVDALMVNETTGMMGISLKPSYQCQPRRLRKMLADFESANCRGNGARKRTTLELEFASATRNFFHSLKGLPCYPSQSRSRVLLVIKPSTGPETAHMMIILENSLSSDPRSLALARRANSCPGFSAIAVTDICSHGAYIRSLAIAGSDLMGAGDSPLV